MESKDLHSLEMRNNLSMYSRPRDRKYIAWYQKSQNHISILSKAAGENLLQKLTSIMMYVKRPMISNAQHLWKISRHDQ
jgi:hypothetical protein